MRAYTRCLYHIVFSTKQGRPTLTEENQEVLHKYIFGILRNKHCSMLRINGVADHLHILINLHPDHALGNLVKEIKSSTAKFIKEKNLFPEFEGWQKGYHAFSVTVHDKERLILYIRNQQEHHRFVSFEEEIHGLLIENEIPHTKEQLALN